MYGGADMNTVIINAASKHDGNGNYIAEKLSQKYEGSAVIELNALAFCHDYINEFRDSDVFKPEMVEEGLRDAMTAVHDSDLIIFIAPNYFSFMSGLAKLFLDRFYVFLNKSGRPRFESPKKFFFIFTQGSANRSHGQSTLDWVKGFCNMLGFKYYGIVVPSCRGADTEGARLKMEEISMSLSMFV